MKKHLPILALPLLLVSCQNTPSTSSGEEGLIKVTFQNGNKVLQVVEIEKGETPIYTGEIPTKDGDHPGFSYDFIGWDQDLTFLQKDTIVSAIYQSIAEETIDEGDFTYRAIYDDSCASKIGYEVRYYNNFDDAIALAVPDTYQDLPILRIGEGCFMDTPVVQVSLPSTLRVIDSYSFNSCPKLEYLEIPEDCRVIHDAAIYADENLLGVDLNQISYLGIDNLHLCPQLEELKVSSNNPFFQSENNCLYTHQFQTLIKAAENIPSFTLHEKTISLKEESLSRLQKVEEITLPEAISSLPEYLFFESKIKKATILGNITTLPERVFSNCAFLTEVVLPSSLKEIKDHAFYRCESLSILSLPASVKSIGQFSFAYCHSLEEFTIPSSLESIGYGALDEQSSLQRFRVQVGNQHFAEHDDCLYTSNYQELLRVPQTKETIAFHPSIQIIGSGAMYQCQKFQKLTLPSSLTLIRDFAFYGMNQIYELSIPDTVSSIGESAFENMENLVEIHLPTSLTILEKGLFANCPLLQIVNIPYGVTELRDEVFSNCINLPSLTFSKNITSFGKDTFAATNMLDVIYYEGTASDWAKIKNRDICGLTNETKIEYQTVIEK